MMVTIRILSCCGMLFFLTTLNLNNISNAFGTMTKDLSISDSQFGAAVSSLSATYITFNLPSNLLMRVLPFNVFFFLIALCWGIAASSMAFVTSFTELVIVRLCLGVAMSGSYSGCVYLFSHYFTTEETASRLAMLLVFDTAASAFGSLLSYGLLNMDGLGGLHGWQWMFLLEGVPSMVAAFVAYFFMPKRGPATATFLAAEERQIICARLAACDERLKNAMPVAVADEKKPILSQSGSDSARFQHSDIEVTAKTNSNGSEKTTEVVTEQPHAQTQTHAAEPSLKDDIDSKVTLADVKAAFLNPRIVAIAFLYMCIVWSQMGLYAFLPALLQKMGFEAVTSVLYAMPLRWGNLAFGLGTAFSSDRFQERHYHCAFMATWFSAAMILQGFATKWSLTTQYVLILLFYGTMDGPQAPLMALVREYAHEPTARAVASGIVSVAGSFGAFIGPMVFSACVNPEDYMGGLFATACPMFVVAVGMVTLKQFDKGRCTCACCV